MKIKLNPLHDDLFQVAMDTVGLLRRSGHKAFFVGGCVRDVAMHINPKEYDISTSADPHEVMRIFPNSITVGVNFGVVIVLRDRFKFEVATFRREESYSDGRHPDNVIYSDDETEDVLRRDFTINGMLYDPFSEELIDYTGGLNDIMGETIKTIGNPNERFKEDKLRMLRAVRFGAQLDYEIEKTTLGAIKEMASSILHVSAERIRDEILKIITQEHPGKGLRLLRETGLLKYILPDVDRMHGVPQPPNFHPEGDVFNHTCLIMDKLYKITDGKQSPELAIGALLHDVGKPDTYTESDRIRFNGHDRIGAEISRRICKGLKLSNKQIEIIASLVREHLKFKDVFNMRESTLKRFLGMPNFEDHLKLHLADCLASHGLTEAYEFVMKKLGEIKIEELKPKLLLNGFDLIEMGYTPGPIFSKILDSLEEAQLEGTLKIKDDATRFVLSNFPLQK
ncbi:MAG: CCA tRNA nucleotidyltransferase [Thermodesulfobacteriota bacterium]